MRYFIGKVNLKQKISSDTDKSEAKRDQLAVRSMEYNSRNSEGFCGGVCSVFKKEATFVFAGSGDDSTMQKEMAAFWEFIGFEGEICETEESCADIVRRRLRMGNVELPDDIYDRLDVESIYRIDADENIVKPKTEMTLSDYAKRYHLPELETEAERIRSSAQNEAFLGHPVHYILEDDSEERAEKTICLLVDTLYRAHRLQSARVITVRPDSFGRFGRIQRPLAALYRNITGGTVVISVSVTDSGDEYADAAEDLIEKACKYAVQYRHEVLTVFHIPQHNTEAHRAIAACLNNAMTMLTFREESVDYDESVSYMKTLCESKGIQTSDTFVDKIDAQQKMFSISEIEKIFNEHYTAYLKQTHFPAYLECQNSAVKESKAEGKAADKLHDMIGLDSVKRVIEESVSFYKLQKTYRERGICLKTPARSMVFTGNPGTAKTTVARLTAKVFKDNGLIESGNIVEVGRADLVGKFVGWTAPTVKAAFQRAKGSILFIDEAYSLVDDRDGMYGDEAINTIVQEMENHREETIVIFAGYPDKMERFLEKNPGLRSRIAFHVSFPDYTPEELLQILQLMAKEQSMKLDGKAEAAALAIFNAAVRIPDFGNGRFVRNVLEQAQMRMSRRLTSGSAGFLTDEQLTTLCAEDFAVPEMCAAAPERRAIGF
ncbi:MAG TPA: AAA family ATPase [Ruminococcus sp.]|nr:AAA family ATPase [Ruminococcus sp.]